MKVLIVEDEAKIAEQLTAAFLGGDYEISHAATLDAAKTLLGSFWPDFVVLDANFPTSDPEGEPEFNAEDLLELVVKPDHISPQIILITGVNPSASRFGDICDWLRTDRISDVLPKSHAWEFLQLLLRHKIELLRGSRFEADAGDLADQEWLRRNYIISRETEMMRVARLLRNIVRRTENDTVLIRGPNGSGKGLIAKAVRRETEAKLGRSIPFVPCRCGALSPELAGSELFGHVRGAFTGATTDRVGLLEQAKDGILFVDNVHLLPTSIQGALLDALQERQFRRLGDNVDRALNARVVVATNANFEDLLSSGSMSEEFYHRITRLEVGLPSLAQRTRDIEPLIKHFTRTANSDEALEFDEAVIKAFQGYRWPGNIRQLENVIGKIHVAVSERKVTMPILKSLNLDYAGRAIEWELPVELTRSSLNEEDYLLLGYGWSKGWHGLGDDFLETVKGWLKQALGTNNNGLVDDVFRKLEARKAPSPRSIHYFKAWLFIALVEGHQASQKQLRKILGLEWDFTNRVACFLAGVSTKEVSSPLETPVIRRTQEGARWIYRL